MPHSFLLLPAKEVFGTLPHIYWPAVGVFSLTTEYTQPKHVTLDCGSQKKKSRRSKCVWGWEKQITHCSRVSNVIRPQPMVPKSSETFQFFFFLHNENINQNLFKKSCTGFAYSFVSDDGLCIVISLPSPLLVQCIPIMLHFALLVYAVTAAHHYGAAWANFNGCHRLQEQMQACQRKQETEAKKGGLLCRG